MRPRAESAHDELVAGAGHQQVFARLGELLLHHRASPLDRLERSGSLLLESGPPPPLLSVDSTEPAGSIARGILAAAGSGLPLGGKRVSRGWLRLAMRAAEISNRHGREALTALTPGSLRALGALPEPHLGELLHRIRVEGLDAAAVAVEARRMRRMAGQKCGRPRLPEYLKASRALARLVSRVRARLRDLGRAAERSEAEAHELRRLATRLIDLGDEIRLRLRPAPAGSPIVR